MPFVAVRPLLAAFKTLTGVLEIPFTVLVKAPLESPNALPLIIFTELPVIPFTVVVKLFADELLSTVLTLLLVAAIPLTVLVKVLPEIANVCVVAGVMDARLIGVLATPFTVVVRLLPDKMLEIEFTNGTDAPVTPLTVVLNVFAEDVLEMEFTIGTVVPVTPLTVVVKLLPDEVLFTEPTLLLVADKPFTVLVKVLPDNDKLLVVAGIIPARFTDEPVTPFTVVVKVEPDKLLEMEFTIGTVVPDIPFTVVVKLLPEELLETEFTIATAVPVTPFTVVVKLLGALLVLLTVVVGDTVAGAHAVPFQVNTCPLLAPVVVPNGEPLIFDTVDVPRFPVTSPVIFAVKAVDEIPLMVLTN